ncbi:nicotinate phosphoribosyltransferase [Sulfitobacter sp. M13]
MKLTTTTLIATLMATGVSTAAMAQTSVDGAVGGAADVSSGVSADVGASGSLSTGSTVNDATDAVAKNGKMAKENYGQLIQELRAGAESNTQTKSEIEAFDTNAKLDVVTVSELKSGNGNTTALDEALEAQAEAVDDMRASVDANADLSAQLKAEGYASEDVVAVRGNGMGGLTLVIDDRG